MSKSSFKIGSTFVGETYPVFVVAEMSGNHGGSLERALEIVRAASRAGATALKLQTYTPNTITLNSKSKDFQVVNDSWSQYKCLWDLYDEAYTPWEWHEAIFAEAKRLKMEIFSSPFDESSVDFLEALNVSAYKIASPEINHIPLLEKIALTKKPVILSSGLSDLDDINLALDTLRKAGVEEIALLKCTTAYPAPIDELNLKTISDIHTRFNVVPGLSDHSIGNENAILSIGLNAKIIEKHITLDDDKTTVDSFFSSSESSFAQLVRSIRNAELALGSVNYDLTISSGKNISGKRSIYVSSTIAAGETFTCANVKCVRPAHGLHPKYYSLLIGKTANKDLLFGHRLNFEDVEW